VLGSWGLVDRLAQATLESRLFSTKRISAVVERLPVTCHCLSCVDDHHPVRSHWVLAPYWRNTWLDSLVMMSALVGVSMPSFWLASFPSFL
jgi:peptide/nickel transport system permease protein